MRTRSAAAGGGVATGSNARQDLVRYRTGVKLQLRVIAGGQGDVRHSSDETSAEASANSASF